MNPTSEQERRELRGRWAECRRWHKIWLMSGNLAPAKRERARMRQVAAQRMLTPTP